MGKKESGWFMRSRCDAAEIEISKHHTGYLFEIVLPSESRENLDSLPSLNTLSVLKNFPPFKPNYLVAIEPQTTVTYLQT
jgi:hypothetical protein